MFKVWDGFVRFFHLGLIVLIPLLYVSAENDQMAVHLIAAYTLLALISTRIIWGIIGSETAKLSALFHHPKQVFKALLNPNECQNAGHNPAGSYMVLIFLGLIMVQLISGLMTSDDVFTDGPLVAHVDYSWVSIASSWHKTNFDILLVAIGIHILAIIVYRIRGKALTKAMITGYSNSAQINEGSTHQPKLKSPWSAFVIFAFLWGGIMWLWGSEPLKELLQLIE